MILDLSQIQEQVGTWARRNFGIDGGYGRKAPPSSWQSLLGMVEEVGELAHAYLKRAQGIRGTTAEHDAAIRDAIGDILIYMLDFASLEGLNVSRILNDTWEKVSQRDWKKNAVDGGVKEVEK
jgi:NTP pyrophosphatase (non-canonical NTP hydrolase)